MHYFRTTASSPQCLFLNLGTADLSLIQQEVDALEELSRQLFLETVDLQATKVFNKIKNKKYFYTPDPMLM